MRPSERWREIVLSRQRQMDAAYARRGGSSADYWEKRAGRFQAHRPIASGDDPVLTTVLELAGPDGSVLDVGAGPGRYSLALAPRVRRVVAVEPAAAMAGYLREAVGASGRDNVEVVEQRWEDAAVPPADVVLCAHVLYPLPDVVPFIERLEAHARRSVVLAMMVTWAEPPLMAALWRRYHGDERLGQPESFDAIAVLHELGIPANVRVAAIPGTLPMWSFDSLDEAVDVSREHLILAPDADRDAELRASLAASLTMEDGRLVMPQPQRSVACIWWDRGGPRRAPL
jgi:SAM-dependent methyltransferase